MRGGHIAGFMTRLFLTAVTLLLMVGAVCRSAVAQGVPADQFQLAAAQSDAPASGPDSAANPPDQSAAKPPDTSEKSEPAPTEGKAGGRMFGVLPNYATVEGASTITPISSRQKFTLAKMNSLDPFLYPFVGVVAAIERQYGPGLGGYAKQYVASFTDNTVGNVMTTAVLPSLLKQDPRYFQRGQGSVLGRMGYSASRLLVTHGDSGRAQFNLSEVGGNAFAATVSNAYYPMDERSLSDTISRWGMQLMWDGLSNELKEFWPDVRRKLERQPKNLAP
jgi:hypothetical protein